MKILLTMNLPYVPALGGANKANQHLAEELAQRGHSVVVVVPALGTPSRLTHTQFLDELASQGVSVAVRAGATIFTLNGVEVHALREASQLRAYLHNCIRIFEPDWALVSSEDPSQNLLDTALKACPSRVIYLVHTAPFLPFGPQAFFPSQRRTQLIRQARAIVVVSEATREYIRRWAGLEATVCYLPAYGSGPFPDYQCFDDGFVTVVNPCQLKGIAIFVALASALPEVLFAAVPGWGTTSADRRMLEGCPNVRLLEPCQDFNQILARTRVLLLPSLGQESFPLTVVEAMLRGIPVLAGDVGGVAEAKLGTSYLLPVRSIERFESHLDEHMLPIPIVPEQPIAAWRDALCQLLADRGHYEHQSAHARAAATQFVAGLSLDPFVALLARLAMRPQAAPDHALGLEDAQLSAPAEQPAIGLADLTPAQRALLMLRLRKKAEAQPEQLSRSSHIQPVPRDGPLPLSFAQERVWFVEQITPGSVIHNIPIAVRLKGVLDRTALEQTIQAIVQRHEVFRTTFVSESGRPRQIIAPALDVPVPLADLRGLPWLECEAELAHVLATEAQRPFDLARGPLLRVLLVCLDDTEHVALVTMHHIISDAWSGEVLIRELVTFYTASRTDQGESGSLRAAQLPDLPIQYADYAVWQRQRLQGDLLDQLLSYWRRQLRGLTPALQLPTDYSRPATPTFRGDIRSRVLPERIVVQLRTLTQQEDATLFMSLLATFKTLLYCYTQQEDMLVGTPIANRQRAETADLVGYFVNALALRIDLSGNPTFRTILRRVRKVALEAFAHQDLPFEKLVETLWSRRQADYAPFFQVVFNFASAPTTALALPGLELSPVALGVGTAKYDLTIYLWEEANQLIASLVFSTDLFEAATIARMLVHFETILGQVVAQPDIQLSMLHESFVEAERKARIMKQEEMKQSSSRKITRGERKPLSVSPESLITTGYLQPGETLPLVVRPAVADVDLINWASSNLDVIDRELMRHGAILFRDFQGASAATFEQVARMLAPELVNYIEGSSPRILTGDKVYTSTEYPPEYTITMHNELSYAHRWPARLLFYCSVAPQQGGETPLADSRKVFELISPQLREKCMHKGVRYTRNMHGDRGAGLSWQTVFETLDPAVVEDYCRAGAIDFRWKADGGLWTSQVRPAVAKHPRTGEYVWFNQVDQWHPSNLGADITSSLLAMVKEQDLPINASYGDGSLFELAELDNIRAAYQQAIVTFPWQVGDILLVDNMLVAHGRMPFVGPRKILVAMGMTIGHSDIEKVA